MQQLVLSKDVEYIYIYISKRILKVSTFYEIFNRWLPEIHWKSLRVVRKPLKYKINFQFLIYFFQRYKQH